MDNSCQMEKQARNFLMTPAHNATNLSCLGRGITGFQARLGSVSDQSLTTWPMWNHSRLSGCYDKAMSQDLTLMDKTSLTGKWLLWSLPTELMESSAVGINWLKMTEA